MPAYSLVVAKTEDAGVLAERADLRPASRNRRWGESVLWVCLRPGSTSNHVFNIEIFLPSQRTRLARCRWRDTCASPRAVAQSSAQTVRIAVIKATILAPSLLVERYLPSGWKTEMTFFTTPADMTNALLTDSVDIAYTGLTIGVVARSRNQPIIVVA